MKKKITSLTAFLFAMSGLFAQQQIMKTPNVFKLMIDGNYGQVNELIVEMDEPQGIVIINNMLINGQRYWQKNSNRVTDGPENSVFWFYDNENIVLELKFAQAIDINSFEFSLITTKPMKDGIPVSSIVGKNSSRQLLMIDQYRVEREK